MAEIYDWNEDADMNDSPPPNGWPEGMSPRQLNNSGREMLAVLARYRESAEGCNPTTGSGNAYLLSIPQMLSSLVAGMRFSFCANHTTTTGTATLQINSIPAVALIGTTPTGVFANDITAGLVYVVSFDGTDMVLLNPTITAPSGLLPLGRIPTTLTGKDGDTVDGFHISTDATGTDENTIYFRS